MISLKDKVHLYPIDKPHLSCYLGIMSNIRFHYLYRDSANYKKYGSVIFANPTNIDLSELEILIRSMLIDDTWFYVDEWGVPELFLDTFDWKIDPTWHEFSSVEHTDEESNILLKLDTSCPPFPI